MAEAKTKNLKYVVFLSDDVKEDWWWMIGEKKIGPHPELRDEIHRISGVTHFHIYTSEQFLKFAPSHLHVTVSEDSIKAMGDLHQLSFFPLAPRTRTSSRSFPEQVVEEIISDFAAELTNSDDQVTRAMAETNALGYGLDEYEITVAEYDPNTDQINFEATLTLMGEHDEDMGFCGDTIIVKVSGTLAYSRGEWKVEDYEIESCEITDY